MKQQIENSGDIETFVRPDPVRVGDNVLLTFRGESDPVPPFQVRVRAPSGKLIVESVLRDLPTDVAQTAKPVTFVASTPGDYKIDIKQLKGKQRGEAILHVTT